MPEKEGVVLGPGGAEIRNAIEQELLKKGLAIAPGEEDLLEALKHSSTQEGPMQVCQSLDQRRQ